MTCTVSVPNATAASSSGGMNVVTFDTVCTAYVHYNDTYWENSSVYATPGINPPEAQAVLDPSSLTLSAGLNASITIWLPAQLTTCPQYFTSGAMEAYGALTSMHMEGFSLSLVHQTFTSPSYTSTFRRTFQESLPL